MGREWINSQPETTELRRNERQVERNCKAANDAALQNPDGPEKLAQKASGAVSSAAPAPAAK